MAAAEPRRHDSFIRHLCQGEIPTIASLALIPSFPASFVIFHPYPATFSLPFPLRFEGLRVAVKKEKGKRGKGKKKKEKKRAPRENKMAVVTLVVDQTDQTFHRRGIPSSPFPPMIRPPRDWPILTARCLPRDKPNFYLPFLSRKEISLSLSYIHTVNLHLTIITFVRRIQNQLDHLFFIIIKNVDSLDIVFVISKI